MLDSTLHEEHFETADGCSLYRTGERSATHKSFVYRTPPEHHRYFSTSYLKCYCGLSEKHQRILEEHEDPVFVITRRGVDFSLIDIKEVYFIENPHYHHMLIVKDDRLMVACDDGSLYVSKETFCLENFFSPDGCIFKQGAPEPFFLKDFDYIYENEVMNAEQDAEQDIPTDPFRVGKCYEDYSGTTYTYAPQYRLNLAILYLEKYIGFDAARGLPKFFHLNGRMFDFSQVSDVCYGFPHGKPEEHFIMLQGEVLGKNGKLFVFSNGDVLVRPGFLEASDDFHLFEDDRFSFKLHYLIKQLS